MVLSDLLFFHPLMLSPKVGRHRGNKGNDDQQTTWRTTTDSPGSGPGPAKRGFGL